MPTKKKKKKKSDLNSDNIPSLQLVHGYPPEGPNLTNPTQAEALAVPPWLKIQPIKLTCKGWRQKKILGWANCEKKKFLTRLIDELELGFYFILFFFLILVGIFF
jgi:hypothetical protein